MSLQSGVIGLWRSQLHWSRLFVSILISFSPCWMRTVLALGFVFNTYTHKHRTVNGQRSSIPAHIQDQSFSAFIIAHTFLCLCGCFYVPTLKRCMLVSVADVVVLMQFTAWSVRKRVGRACCCCFLWIKHTMSDGRSREKVIRQETQRERMDPWKEGRKE